jgi:hypothetical protein
MVVEVVGVGVVEVHLLEQLDLDRTGDLMVVVVVVSLLVTASLGMVDMEQMV